MRVGLVIYGELNTVSGGYLYDRQLVDFLQKQGDQVVIFSQEPRSYGRNLLDNLSSSLIEEVQHADPDVLLEDELNHPSLILPNRRFRGRLNSPVIAIVHHLRSSEDHPAWQNALYRRLERQYLRSVDGFIFNGQTTRSVVETIAGVAEPSVVAVPGGNRLSSEIREDEILERSRRDGPLHIVFLGSVIPRKGLHTLLDALVSLPSAGWRLSVIGRMDVDEGYTAAIKRQIGEARLVENVTMYGILPDREIARLLRDGDLLAMPSTYEGYGIAYLEGMAFGLPALATTSGAAREIITHGEDGWLVEPGDAGAIAAIITEARADREKLADMSLAARRRFLAHPGWEDSMSRIRSFLISMTGAR